MPVTVGILIALQAAVFIWVLLQVIALNKKLAIVASRMNRLGALVAASAEREIVPALDSAAKVADYLADVRVNTGRIENQLRHFAEREKEPSKADDLLSQTEKLLEIAIRFSQVPESKGHAKRAEVVSNEPVSK